MNTDLGLLAFSVIVSLETITKEKKMSNVAYLRVSHTESLNGTSLTVQKRLCFAFAELHGFSIDVPFRDSVCELLNTQYYSYFTPLLLFQVKLLH